MSDKPGFSRDDHSAEVMAGLEIVDTESAGTTGPGHETVKGEFNAPDSANSAASRSGKNREAARPDRSEGADRHPMGEGADGAAPFVPRPSDEPIAALALSPVQAMWNGSDNDWNGRDVPVKPKRPRPPKSPRSPLVALPATVALALVAAFFAWVSAEPFLLAVGHDIDGTVTVNECAASGIAPRCEGEFLPVGGVEKMPGVRITGDADAKQEGETVAAQAVSAGARTVYVGDAAGLWIRWGAGFGLLLACGVAISVVTGAWHWHGRARSITVAISMGGPVLLWLGCLAVTW